MLSFFRRDAGLFDGLRLFDGLGLNRREILRAGGLSLFGLTMPEVVCYAESRDGDLLSFQFTD